MTRTDEVMQRIRRSHSLSAALALLFLTSGCIVRSEITVDATGRHAAHVDLGEPPLGSSAAAQVGRTLRFQAWHREPLGGPFGSGFTDAVRVTFE